MGEISKKIVEDYRQAREDGDYAAQAGILVGLLQLILRNDESMSGIARDTAEAILQVRASA